MENYYQHLSPEERACCSMSPAVAPASAPLRGAPRVPGSAVAMRTPTAVALVHAQRTDSFNVSQGYLSDMAHLMDALHRKTFGWQMPNQALEEEIANFPSRVELAS